IEAALAGGAHLIPVTGVVAAAAVIRIVSERDALARAFFLTRRAPTRAPRGSAAFALGARRARGSAAFALGARRARGSADSSGCARTGTATRCSSAPIEQGVVLV